MFTIPFLIGPLTDLNSLGYFYYHVLLQDWNAFFTFTGTITSHINV